MVINKKSIKTVITSQDTHISQIHKLILQIDLFTIFLWLYMCLRVHSLLEILFLLPNVKYRNRQNEIVQK